jgi:hypothetical protein
MIIIGSILYAWFRRYDEVVSDEVHERTSRGIVAAGTTYRLPAPLYVDKPIGVCTRCEAMTGDADAKLKVGLFCYICIFYLYINSLMPLAGLHFCVR